MVAADHNEAIEPGGVDELLGGSESELPSAQDAAASSIARKIVYEGEMELLVKEFAAAVEQIEQLVAESQGFVASSSLHGTTGDSRRGSWTVRVPVDRYGRFLRDVGKLGQVRKQQLTSREVTAEYFDAETRARNKHQEEARLLEHLRTTTTLDETLTVEKELVRVRCEIEQLEGLLRVLGNLAALSTLTINIEEVQVFVAPTPFIPPTFAEQIATTWQASTTSFLAFAKASVLVLVVASPWLAAALCVSLLWFIVRRVCQRGGRSIEPRPGAGT